MTGALTGKRIQLMPMGAWYGRDGKGPYRVDGIKAARRIVAASIMPQSAMVIDYDHQTVLAPPVGGVAPAAGWVTALHALADGIWADVEWTPHAQAAIAAREYRYVSPYYHHSPDLRITRIVNAGLVNMPNFELAAVATCFDVAPVAGLSATERDVARRLGVSEDDFLAARR